MEGTRITVVVKLPAGLAQVGALLAAVAANFPDAVVDTDHPDGWRIICESTP